MASSSGNRKTSTKKTAGKRGTSGRKKNRQQTMQDVALFYEIGWIAFLAGMVFLFFCNFGMIGPVGAFFSNILFGLFGLTAYIAPIFIFLAAAYRAAHQTSPAGTRKVAAAVVLFVMGGILCELMTDHKEKLLKYDGKLLYELCSAGKNGGGVLAGSIAYALQHYLETIGTILVVLLCVAISIIILTEKSLLDGVRSGQEILRDKGREGAERRREYAEIRRQEQEEVRAQREQERQRRAQERMEERFQKEEERRLRDEERENEKILRMDRKVTGVTTDTVIRPPEHKKRREDVHEIVYEEKEKKGTVTAEPVSGQDALLMDRIRIHSMHPVSVVAPEEADELPDVGAQAKPYPAKPPKEPAAADPLTDSIRIHKEGIREPEPAKPAAAAQPMEKEPEKASKPPQAAEKKTPQKYMFPPLSRLQKGVAQTGDSTTELKETALRLQQTLHTFGVKVTITDISQGPSVTRYELQPEQGVKVSKIVGLSDDIKLNLAATDIRIEAPIPGKAAIGIEVPNKENMMVALRDLLESKEFKEFPSNLAFAVGKDIAGKTIVTDIAKMPHMLIAGSTGSGKSVCINTLIMSILYKAHPDDVKLIMVDPKVVELSVYNGIPHLLIPVVTDPKKASAALHWAVTEMEDRYRKFADFNVRDLKGYNQKVESMAQDGQPDAPHKLPQIVIIVDELADLMMVSPGEVEESICRLAQLARACGIHLIIATQRPSVDVITGLIKANMPSRVAFAVSSGVDSRTILDMVGAEKLLGKGDMLFYPQGYSKPARIQGAFVSDREVSDVVDFLKNQVLGNTYAEDIEQQIQTIGTSAPGAGASEGAANARDEYFAEAGRFIIDKDKASIGMLQRVLKIGFNRAARIMDQLCEYGVVGEEEGTKPRKVLMSLEQFEQLLEDI